MTQLERVMEALRAQVEICSISDFYANYLPNGRNEISTLMRRYLWKIEKTWYSHGHTHHLHYKLIEEGRSTPLPKGPPKQLELME